MKKQQVLRVLFYALAKKLVNCLYFQNYADFENSSQADQHR